MYKDKRKYSLLYLSIFSIYSYLYILQYSLLDINIFYKFFCVASIIILIIMYFTQGTMRRKTLFFSFIVTLVFCISWYKTGQTEFILVIMFFICAHFTNIDNIIKCSAIFTLLGVLTVFGCSWCGIVEDIVYTFTNRNVESVHCWGFNYYSGPVYPLFFVSLSYMWLKKEKICVRDIFAFLVFNFGLYRIFSLKLTFLCAIIASLIEIAIVRYNKLDLRKRKFLCFATISFPIMALVSNLLCYYYNPSNKLMFWINTLTNRLRYGQIGFKEYGVTLLGQKIDMYGVYSSKILSKQYFYIDIGYVYSLLVYGLLAFMLILFIYTWLYRKACQNNDKWTFMWVTVILVFTAINNVWLTISYNPILLFAAVLLNERNKTRRIRGNV